MQPELYIMNWVLSGPPNHKIGCTVVLHHQMADWAKAGPEGISKLHQMTMVPTPATLPSPSQPAQKASWGVPCDQLIEEKP